MRGNNFYRPISENAETVYDECLNIENGSDFTLAWYGIFRAARYYLCGRNEQSDPDAVLILPFKATGCVMGFGLAGVYIGKPEFDEVILKFVIDCDDQAGIIGVLEGDDFEINVTGSMTGHLMDTSIKYQCAVNTETVLSPEDRSR